MDCCTQGHLLSSEMIQYGGRDPLVRNNHAAYYSIQDNVLLHSTHSEPYVCDFLSRLSSSLWVRLKGKQWFTSLCCTKQLFLNFHNKYRLIHRTFRNHVLGHGSRTVELPQTVSTTPRQFGGVPSVTKMDVVLTLSRQSPLFQ